MFVTDWGLYVGRMRYQDSSPSASCYLGMKCKYNWICVIISIELVFAFLVDVIRNRKMKKQNWILPKAHMKSLVTNMVYVVELQAAMKFSKS